MKSNLTLTLVLLFALMSSCAKMDSIDFSKQKVLFQKEYINYAWGKSHFGWYIDSMGAVYSYRLPEEWNFPDSNNVISNVAVEQNLTKTSFKFKIDASELAEKVKLMNDAAKGSLVKSDLQMADAGISCKFELIYQPDTKTYKRVLLSQWGDISISNVSPDAAKLSQWMDSIDAKVYPMNNQ